jgi:hypothetical protein
VLRSTGQRRLHRALLDRLRAATRRVATDHRSARCLDLRARRRLLGDPLGLDRRLLGARQLARRCRLQVGDRRAERRRGSARQPDPRIDPR